METASDLDIAIKMQKSFVPVEQKKRCRKVSEEHEDFECTSAHGASSILDKESQAETRQKKIKPSKSMLQTRDFDSTAKSLISEFEDIALVSSSDSDTTLSIDDTADGITFAPSTLVWAPNIGKKSISSMWPSQVVDPAACSNDGMCAEVTESPQFLSGGNGKILVYYFGHKKFGWIDKSQLKLFSADQADIAKYGNTKRFQGAVNKALKASKDIRNSNSQKAVASLEVSDVIEIKDTTNKKKAKCLKVDKEAKKSKKEAKKSKKERNLEPSPSDSSVPQEEKLKNLQHIQINLSANTASGSRKKMTGMRATKSSRANLKKMRDQNVAATQRTEAHTEPQDVDPFVVSCILKLVMQVY